MKPIETNGTFKYENAYCPIARRERIVWGYKDRNGVMHSGIEDSLQDAINKAKEFGYHPSEFKFENRPKTHFINPRLYLASKPKSDLQSKLYDPEVSEDRKLQQRRRFIKRLAATTVTLGILSAIYTNPIGIIRSSIEQRRIKKQLPSKVNECFEKACKIKYKSDGEGKDYWQTPQETEEKGEGDCEDIAAYLRYLLKKEGTETEMVMGIMMESAYFTMHAWNEYEHNGEELILDATAGKIFKRKALEEKGLETYIKLEVPSTGPKDFIDERIKRQQYRLKRFVERYCTPSPSEQLEVNTKSK
ncbi:MAG: transglutaminase domain-containing protein [Planctomycetota bacterium]|jgi:predicted transglutaminase-like cysteine proteinase